MSSPLSTGDQEEKSGTFTDIYHAAAERYAEGAGDLQVLKAELGDYVKLASDGQTVLIPQPSDDPNEPLNWTSRKKTLVMTTIIFASLLTDFGMAYGVPLFEAQTFTFHMSLPDVAHSISGGLFLQGPGGLFAAVIVQRLGRLPVLFWSQYLAAFMVLGAALSPNYATFTAFRALQGFVNTAPQVIGLSIVHDMYFFHERTRRINLWVLCFMGGPSLGPFVSGWLVTAISWQAVYGFLASLHALSTLIVVFLGDETWYDSAHQQPSKGGLLERIKLLVGITGARREGMPKMWDVTRLLFELQFKPQVFFLTVVYITVLFAWVVGVTTTITEILVPPPYSFSAQGIANSFLAPLIGAIIGELWGHWFNDWLCARYIRQHKGLYVLENRLWGSYCPSILAFGALILYGQALEHTLQWSALLIAWALLTFALIAGTTPVSAYALDTFPNQAALLAAIINMWRTAGGFSVNYFQLSWIHATGPGISFGCQAMILGVAFIFGVVITQMFGRKWRHRYPPPKVTIT